MPNPGDPQSLNRYAYVQNNPLRYTDPSGHMPDGQIAEALGFETVQQLYDSDLWKMWNDSNIGDAYWLKVLQFVQSGDRLGASERSGELLFKAVDGIMRIFGEAGATSTNLWDWQGAGFYTIDRPGKSEREDAVFSDAAFGTAASEKRQLNPLYGVIAIPQYRYDGVDSRTMSMSLTGFQLLERNVQFQFSGIINVAFGLAAPGVDYGVDAVMAVAGLAVTPWVGPTITGIGIGKAVLDLGVSVYQTFADPVYKYR